VLVLQVTHDNQKFSISSFNVLIPLIYVEKIKYLLLFGWQFGVKSTVVVAKYRFVEHSSEYNCTNSEDVAFFLW